MDKLRGLFPRRPSLGETRHAEAKIECSSEEIRRILHDGSVCSTRWDELARLCAYKIDLFTTDEIRLVFVSDHGDSMEISEEHEGFSELFEMLQARIPGFLDGWEAVMKPAFARNETILFAKPIE